MVFRVTTVHMSLSTICCRQGVTKRKRTSAPMMKRVTATHLFVRITTAILEQQRNYVARVCMGWLAVSEIEPVSAFNANDIRLFECDC